MKGVGEKGSHSEGTCIAAGGSRFGQGRHGHARSGGDEEGRFKAIDRSEQCYFSAALERRERLWIWREPRGIRLQRGSRGSGVFSCSGWQPSPEGRYWQGGKAWRGVHS